MYPFMKSNLINLAVADVALFVAVVLLGCMK